MAITFVGALYESATEATSITNPYAPTSGHLLVVTGSVWRSSTPSLSITDTRGNTIPAATTDVTLASVRQMIWLIPNCIGGSGNFTLTAGSGSDVNLEVAEYSGASLTAALDGTPVTNSSSTETGTITVGPITMTNAGSMLVAGYYDSVSDHAVTLSGTAALTQRENGFNPGPGTFEYADNVAAGIGTFSATMTWVEDDSNSCVISMIGIQAAGSGPGPAPQVSSLSSFNLGPG
jgi:hypothetical protein